MSIIPDELQPEDTGSDGTQVQSTALVPIEAAKPALNIVAETVTGIATSHSRQMGNDATAQIVAANFRQATLDLQQARQDMQRKEDELRAANSRLQEVLTTNATLRERLTSAQQHRRLREFAIGLGFLLLGTGLPTIPLSTGPLQWFGVALSVVGVATLLICHFSGDRRATP